ncbi:hypothetical protein OG474_30250 [Kribbella sp. NBC_01505]|uniref:hypothetical protein n=1 Tax=Kribbella sp. NBC_01505 TaxID=2903580 RepID=UPI003864EE50
MRGLMAGVLAESDKDELRSETRIKTLQAEGFRIIDGGPTGDRDDAGELLWKNVDWHTREVLSEGVGLESYDASPEESWYHIDHVETGEQYNAAVTKLEASSGLPPSLATAITDWAQGHLDEAAELVEAMPETDAVVGLIALGASHGYGISFRQMADQRWEVGWLQRHSGGWFGLTADSLAEAAAEVARKDLPELVLERSARE